MYIKQIKFKNFKLFPHHEIELTKELNIILGAHATGKSTIIDAIRFVIDPQYETSSENLNLNNFKYKPPNSNYSETGYVKLSFFNRDNDELEFVVSRNFSNLNVVIIDKTKELKMQQFYKHLRDNNFYTNSFMSSFIDSEVLYKWNKNTGLFKNVDFYISEHVKLVTDIYQMILCNQNILKTKIENLTEDMRDMFSGLCDHGTGVLNRFYSMNIFSDYIYNLKKQRNINHLLQTEVDILDYLEECQYEMFDVHAMNWDNMVNLANDIRIKTKYSNFIDLSEFTKKIAKLLDKLHNKIKNIHGLNINSIVSYPMQLDAQQQINQYVMDLRRNLKIKKIIIKSIKGDIELLNSIIRRKQSEQANIVRSIETNLYDFIETKNNLENYISILASIKEDDSFQQFNDFIEFFLNDRLFYYKMKLKLSFDYHSSILNGIQFTIPMHHDHRIIPVFTCMQFKNDFVIKDNLYEYLKPILDWTIVIETDDLPFVIPNHPKNCHVTWVPSKHLYIKSSIILNSDFQYIWDGLNFEALHEMKVLIGSEKKILKFILYQQQLTTVYETSLLADGHQSRPNNIIELCEILQSFYRISILRNDYKLLQNMFTNETDIPDQLFRYKENLDSIILITKNLTNDFSLLLNIVEQIEYHNEDLKLKKKCLKQFNDDILDIDLFGEVFNLPRYQKSREEVDQYKSHLNDIENVCSTLDYKFNKLFLEVFIPLDEFIIIVPNSHTQLQNFDDWNAFMESLSEEFSYSKEISDNNRTAIAELRSTLSNLKKTFITEDVEFSRIIYKNDSISKGNIFTKMPFYKNLQIVTNLVPFIESLQGEMDRAIKTLQKVKHIKFTKEAHASMKIQIHDQVNKSIELANELLENFNHKIQIKFYESSFNTLNKNITNDNKLNLLESLEFLIQKNVNYYNEESTITSVVDKMPSQGDYYLAKLMFIFGVSLYNNHKLITFDDISVILNKNKDILLSISQLEEICQDQQVIMTCTPAEIIVDDIKELHEYFTNVANCELVNCINTDGFA